MQKEERFYPPVPNSAISQEKKALRKSLKAKREALPLKDRKAASQEMLKKLYSSSLYRQAKIILSYMPIGSEVDVSPLLKEKDKIICLPLLFDQNRMEAALFCGPLQKDRYGILAPPRDSLLYDPCSIDLILCPLLSVDAQGFRLGYGGGYYDRYLMRSKAVRIGLCYEEMRTASLPHDALDVAMDYILTQNRFDPV